MSPLLDQSTIEDVTADVSVATALSAIEWAVETMGERLCLLASMQDALLIDLAMRVDQRIAVVFIDTGYHFAETHQTLRAIEARYGIAIECVGPDRPLAPSVEPGECCASKVEHLERALADRDGWISGISRVQTTERASASLVELDQRSKIKVNPLAQWNLSDRNAYIRRHGLIEHPLRAAGYESIGCEPCTTVGNNSDARSGRWAGSAKTECGLHI